MHNHRIGANRTRKARERTKTARAGSRKIGRRLLVPAFVGLCLCALALAAAIALPRIRSLVATSSFFNVSAIRVNAALHLDETRILTTAGVVPGMSMTAIDPARIREALMHNPWVRTVLVRRWWPGKVTIGVVERMPVVLVNLGRIWQMDGEGVLLELPEGEHPDLPVVSGLRDTVVDGLHRLRATDLDRFTSFCNGARAGSPAMFKRISQMEFTRQDRVRLTLSAVQGMVVVDEEHVTDRIHRLYQLVRTMTDTELNQARRIDLCYGNLAFVQQAGTARRDQ